MKVMHSLRRTGLLFAAAAVLSCGAALAGDQALRFAAPVGDATDPAVINQPSLARGTAAGRNSAEALRFSLSTGDATDPAVINQPSRASVTGKERGVEWSMALRYAAPVTDHTDSAVLDQPVAGRPAAPYPAG